MEFVLFRAKILVEKKDYIHAVSLLDVYARQDSTSLDYLLLRSRVQLDWSKNTSAATENIEKALQLYPENTEALMFAARISSPIDSPVAGKYADELAAKVQETTVRLYSKLGCSGVVRIDYISSEEGLYFLEVNTIPGMTSASLVPKMVRAAGIDMTDFLSNIIEHS